MPAGRRAVDAALTLRDIYTLRALTPALARFGHDPVAALFTPRGRIERYRHYEELRRRGPWVPSRVGTTVVTSHRLAGALLRNRRLGASPTPDDSARMDPRHIVDLSLLILDPPDHTRLRRLVAPAFSPRRLDRFGPLVSRVVDDLVAALPTDEPVDLVEHFAAPLPVTVIAELLGIPESDRARFRDYGQALAQVLDGFRSLRHWQRVRRTEHELAEVFTRLFALRRADPRDDVVTDLVRAPEGSVTPQEMVTLCQLLLVAGFETTVNLIGSTLLHLHRSGQWPLLTADPALAAAAAEETLRFDPPVQMTGRHALRDLEIDGHAIARNEIVIIVLGATGRDPDVFARPDVYDLTRTPEAEHLAFSAGAHYCLGAPLARLEARTALATLARERPGLRPAGVARPRNLTTLRGPAVLPAVLARAA